MRRLNTQCRKACSASLFVMGSSGNSRTAQMASPRSSLCCLHSVPAQRGTNDRRRIAVADKRAWCAKPQGPEQRRPVPSRIRLLLLSESWSNSPSPWPSPPDGGEGTERLPSPGVVGNCPGSQLRWALSWLPASPGIVLAPGLGRQDAVRVPTLFLPHRQGREPSTFTYQGNCNGYPTE